MPYPKKPQFRSLIEQLNTYADLRHEQGAKPADAILRQAERALRSAIRKLQALPTDPKLARREPDNLPAIRKLRPPGPRRLWHKINAADYLPRLEGALLARCAGCVLGAIVELWSIDDMQRFAHIIGDSFPPTNYWSQAANPQQLRYGTSRAVEFTRHHMNGVPVDDDLAYTLLGLLIVENFGPDFTTDDVGRAWLKYLPHACTAEHVALENLKHKIPPRRAGAHDNPFTAWIGADIRSDPWGYLAPGYPEKAAELAYRDAFISHRRTGIYGEMFFAAAIAAAFTVDDPLTALEIGLTEIPARCEFAHAVRWALHTAPTVKNYAHARAAVDRRFPGMSPIHTTNNACLSIFGLALGKKNLTRTLSQTVAMGHDNDCTAATAGSLLGAVIGQSKIPPRWHKPFHNTVHSYLIGHHAFKIDDLLRRFHRAARRISISPTQNP